MGCKADNGIKREDEERDISDRRRGKEKVWALDYTVRYETKAAESLGKLPENLRKRIILKISSTKQNPFHYFSRLEQRSEFKLRVGDYRVIADIDVGRKLIILRVVGHRKKVYKE
jgi:mRNA interferase RelE/StbE